jgi:predicted membrane protein
MSLPYSIALGTFLLISGYTLFITYFAFYASDEYERKLARGEFMKVASLLMVWGVAVLVMGMPTHAN